VALLTDAANGFQTKGHVADGYCQQGLEAVFISVAGVQSGAMGWFVGIIHWLLSIGVALFARFASVIEPGVILFGIVSSGIFHQVLFVSSQPDYNIPTSFACINHQVIFTVACYC